MFFITRAPRLTALWSKTTILRPLVRSKSRCRPKSKLKPTEQIDASIALATPEELQKRKKLSSKILIWKEKTDVSPISGIPAQFLRDRRVRIYKPSKNAMQSGTNNLHHWQIEFDARQRWENPLMGWTSTGDPLSNLQINFGTKEEAIEYCERNRWRWFVDVIEKPKKRRVKSYGINFHHKNRTRVSTK